MSRQGKITGIVLLMLLISIPLLSCAAADRPADLSISKLEAQVIKRDSGNTVSVITDLYNQGGSPIGPVDIDFYLVNEAYVDDPTLPNAYSQWGGFSTVEDPVGVKQYYQDVAYFPLPDIDLMDNFYILAEVNAEKELDEISFANNQKITTYAIPGIGKQGLTNPERVPVVRPTLVVRPQSGDYGKPDLMITDLDAYIRTRGTNREVAIFTDLYNIGTGPSGETTLDIWLVNDVYLNDPLSPAAEKYSFGHKEILEFIDQRMIYTDTTYNPLPKIDTTEPYYVMVQVNPDSSMAEDDYTNNIAVTTYPISEDGPRMDEIEGLSRPGEAKEGVMEFLETGLNSLDEIDDLIDLTNTAAADGLVTKTRMYASQLKTDAQFAFMNLDNMKLSDENRLIGYDLLRYFEFLVKAAEDYTQYASSPSPSGVTSSGEADKYFSDAKDQLESANSHLTTFLSNIENWDFSAAGGEKSPEEWTQYYLDRYDTLISKMKTYKETTVQAQPTIPEVRKSNALMK